MSDVFVCYSHADSHWHDRLKVHLKPLERKLNVIAFSDRDIAHDQNWRNRIEAEIKSARFGILLVSADFLASDFIVEKEMPLLIERRGKGLKVYTLFVSACNYKIHPEIEAYQAFNAPDQPLNDIPSASAEKILANLTADISSQASQVDKGASISDDEQHFELLRELDYSLVHSRRTFNDVRISIPRMIYELGGSEISGFTFEGCDIVGPAVIAFNLGRITGCRFGIAGTVDSILLQTRSSWVSGVIAMSYSNIYNSRFKGIGFLDSDDAMRQTLNNQSAT